MAMLQSETPNLDLPPTQFSAAHDHDDDDDNNDDDDDDVFDMMMMMVTLTFVVDDDVYLDICGVDDDDDVMKIFTWSTRASTSDRIAGGSVIARASMSA